MALPSAYAPISIALQFIVARRPLLHVEAVVLEEVGISYYNGYFFLRKFSLRQWFSTSRFRLAGGSLECLHWEANLKPFFCII